MPVKTSERRLHPPPIRQRRPPRPPPSASRAATSCQHRKRRCRTIRPRQRTRRLSVSQLDAVPEQRHNQRRPNERLVSVLPAHTRCTLRPANAMGRIARNSMTIPKTPRFSAFDRGKGSHECLEHGKCHRPGEGPPDAAPPASTIATNAPKVALRVFVWVSRTPLCSLDLGLLHFKAISKTCTRWPRRSRAGRSA